MRIFAGLLLLIMLVSLNGALATTYKSYVDQDYGFYRVIGIGENLSATGPARTFLVDINYTNKTLNINIGDTVTWINDATPDWPLTIISEQKLWGDRDAYLRWNYQKFNYTFNEPGTYSVYIKECRRCQNQTIIVNPNVIISTLATPTTIPEQTETIVAIKTPIETPTNVIPGFTIVFGILILVLLSLRHIKNR